MSGLDTGLLFLPQTRLKNWTEIEEAVEESQPDLIVIDSLTSAVSALFGKIPDSSESQKWQEHLSDRLRVERAVRSLAPEAAGDSLARVARPDFVVLDLGQTSILDGRV